MDGPPAVIGATLAGLAGVFAFHTHPGAGVLAGGKGSSAAPPPSSPAKGRAGKSTPTTQPPASSTPSTAARPAAPPTSAPATTATGTSIQYGYGVLAVRVTISGTRIASVSVPKLQTADSYSQTLAVQVIPMLRSEVLSVQSARINGITGATYTSEAFAQSLQKALTKLHFA